MSVWRTLAGGVMALAVLALLAGHSLGLPAVKVDQTTIALLILLAVAVLLPDLTKLTGPGGWEADFQRNLKEAERELGKTRVEAPRSLTTRGGAIPPQAGNRGMRLAQLRGAVERAVRELGPADPDMPLNAHLDQLARDRRINGSLRRSLLAFLRATDAYFGERRGQPSRALTRALAVGEEVLERLTGQSGRV